METNIMPRRLTPFVRRLRQLRKAAGLSQYELARRSGLTRQAISNLEKGNRAPTWETVCLLAKGLGVSVAAFEETPE
jgi:transcriptional regulator with XRE-family HTH domain